MYGQVFAPAKPALPPYPEGRYSMAVAVAGAWKQRSGVYQNSDI